MKRVKAWFEGGVVLTLDITADQLLQCVKGGGFATLSNGTDEEPGSVRFGFQVSKLICWEPVE